MRALYYLNILLILFFCSCNQKSKNKEALKMPEPTVLDQVVVISNNAPGKYPHMIIQDSIGIKVEDTLGPRMYLPDYGFSYLDDQNNVLTWTPEKGKPDTLVISSFTEFFELSSYNPFTSIKETFLVKKGDTIIFNYKDKLPIAKIPNREVNDIELNYNRYRHKKLFQDKYSTHQMVILNPFFTESFDRQQNTINTINYYLESKEAYELEVTLLDSLLRTGQISEINHQYRVNALDGMMEKHKDLKTVREWLATDAGSKEDVKKAVDYDLKHTDSLMKFSFFRDYLNSISKYELSRIVENNGSSGGSYIDSRIKFDKIMEDDRFNQTAKNFLLFEAYKEIGMNFKVKDKEEYFKKLQTATTDHQKLRKLKEDYKLNFNLSDKLILTDLKGETIEFHDMIAKNNGKILYLDFWASWCAPCRKTMPASRKLQQTLTGKNIEFIYLAFNDDNAKWRSAIKKDSLQDSQHYFIENANTSLIVEDLGIKTIPHYIIYNGQGEIINGFAKRPGEGALEQLQKIVP